jgi:uncharacterized protein (DUF1778 family)
VKLHAQSGFVVDDGRYRGQKVITTMSHQDPEPRDQLIHVRASRTDRRLLRELAVATGRDLSEAVREAIREVHGRVVGEQPR